MLDLLRSLRRAVGEGRLPAGCERLALVPGGGGSARVAFKLNLAPSDPGRPGWQNITAGERQARALLDAIQRFLVENVADFRQATLSQAAPQLGVRTGRRIRGGETLTDEAVLECRKAGDGIARGCWPMSFGHGRRAGLRARHGHLPGHRLGSRTRGGLAVGWKIRSRGGGHDSQPDE